MTEAEVEALVRSAQDLEAQLLGASRVASAHAAALVQPLQDLVMAAA